MITIAPGGDGILEIYRSQKAEIAAENVAGTVSECVTFLIFLCLEEKSRF